VKGKLANGVGSQYPSHYLGTMYPALLPLMRTPRLLAVDWTDAPADLNGFVRFAERLNLVSAHVPSYFKRTLNLDRENSHSVLASTGKRDRPSDTALCDSQADGRVVQRTNNKPSLWQ